MTLGPVIKRLRAAGGRSQKDFAEQLEISPSYLSLIETDQREATIPLLRRMASELGIPAVVFFASALGSAATEQGEEALLLKGVIDKMVDVVSLSVTQMSLGLGDKAE